MQSTPRFRIARAASLSRRRLRTLVAIAAATLLTAACDGNGVSAPGTLASITVTPTTPMFTSSTQQMVAVGYDDRGRTVTITPAWAVVNFGGTIDGVGVFSSGGTPGTFVNTVQATSNGITGAVTVTVNQQPPPPASAALGSAAAFAVLAGSGISCAGSGTVEGGANAPSIGSWPTPTVIGFPPCTLWGVIPSPATIAAAHHDLNVAFLAAIGSGNCTNLAGFDLGYYDGSTAAKTLGPGYYCSSAVTLTGTMKLTGSSTDRWTFQIGGTLTAEVGSVVEITNVPADNVTWAVGSAVLKAGSIFGGNILAARDITLQNGASLFGRALAVDGAVDMSAGDVVVYKP